MERDLWAASVAAKAGEYGGFMVDRMARRRVSVLLKRLALGRIKNYECEDGLLELVAQTNDPVVFALFRTVRELSGDAEDSMHTVFARGGEMRRRLCRWLVFLRTDLEYRWPRDRQAPGLRDLYRTNWFDRLFRRERGIAQTTARFCSQGDYHVWPFLTRDEFDASRMACRQRCD